MFTFSLGLLAVQVLRVSTSFIEWILTVTDLCSGSYLGGGVDCEYCGEVSDGVNHVM